jgi:hypothetical protein
MSILTTSRKYLIKNYLLRNWVVNNGIDDIVTATSCAAKTYPKYDITLDSIIEVVNEAGWWHTNNVTPEENGTLEERICLLEEMVGQLLDSVIPQTNRTDDVVPVGEAIVMSGKAPATVYRHLKQGKLSRSNDGSGGIEVAELERVYGNSKLRI